MYLIKLAWVVPGYCPSHERVKPVREELPGTSFWCVLSPPANCLCHAEHISPLSTIIYKIVLLHTQDTGKLIVYCVLLIVNGIIVVFHSFCSLTHLDPITKIHNGSGWCHVFVDNWYLIVSACTLISQTVHVSGLLSPPDVCVCVFQCSLRTCAVRCLLWVVPCCSGWRTVWSRTDRASLSCSWIRRD